MVHDCKKNKSFADVDLDLNCIITHANRNCSYFTIKKFDHEYSKYNKSNNHLSLFHKNIRSSSHKNVY